MKTTSRISLGCYLQILKELIISGMRALLPGLSRKLRRGVLVGEGLLIRHRCNSSIISAQSTFSLNTEVDPMD